MKKLLFLLILGVSGLGVFAQIENPVTWSYESRQTGPDEHEVVFKATIEAGWHLYSQFVEEGGPIPTSFNFDEPAGFELVGKTEEKSTVHKDYDPNFEMDLLYFSNEAIFVQKIKRTAGQAEAKGFLEFMVCNDVKCLPPEQIDFSFALKNTLAPASGSTQEATPKVKEQTAPQKEEAPKESSASSKSTEPSLTPQITLPGEDAQADASGILTPVKWEFTHRLLEELTYELRFTARIDDGWKIYSQFVEEGGPIPTEFTFTEGSFSQIDKVVEQSEALREHDEVFDMEVASFKHEAVFIQKIKFSSPEQMANIRGELVFMACDTGRCLPPDYVPFLFDLTGSGEALDAPAASTTPTGMEGNPYFISSVDLDNPVANCGEGIVQVKPQSGLLSIFVLGFIGGLLALLTPCVFPMIPLTVSFFTKSGGDNNKRKGMFNALSYGFFILLIYVILSLPFHFMESVDPEILNTVSTSVILNVAFFVIFVAFALSFFGYYELTLPSSFTNKVSSASSIGGILGIFFMALTLAIVSFSCTGPILGSLLAGSLSSDGGAMQLSAGMAGFGLALALPFGLFAAFPGWLNSLPRSGGWMNTVKVVLGFVELALAVKFLSNADLVEHWGLLKREIFIGLWVVIGIAAALYLFGFIRFPHDDPTAKPSKGRLAIGALATLFVLYLLPGLSNTKYANLQFLSGFPPPMFYSLYEKQSNCPLDLNCFKDYEEGMAYAKANNKPVMIDFTGWACVNCRKMEENVWVKPEIYNRLNKEYVLISLYVDDRKQLPQEEQSEVVIQNGRTKKIRTVGNKWATLQTLTFNNNSQPFYVLMTPDEQLLNNPVGYTPDVSEYRNFLDCGLDAYQEVTRNQGAEKGMAAAE